MKCCAEGIRSHECYGGVYNVIVIDRSTWSLRKKFEMEFVYCQAAIDSDRKMGLEVKILEEK